jgi:hypothetical protein
MKHRMWIVPVITAMLSLFSACAEKGPVLLEGVAYQVREGIAAPGKSKIVVGISPFKDERGKMPSVLGQRTIRNDIENDLVVQGSVADIVAAALKSALKARGISARDVPVGDPSFGTFKAEGANIVVGGEINSLWVTAVSQPLKVKVNADVHLRVSVADAAAKKVLRTLVLNSKVEREDIAFSFDTVAGALSEALSGAIDQLMQDDEFKKLIQ